MKTASGQSAFAQNRVATTSGVVEGTRERGSEIMIFRGIPFAEPPIRDLRFAPPQPVRSWSGVHKADRFGRVDLRQHPHGLAAVEGPHLPVRSARAARRSP